MMVMMITITAQSGSVIAARRYYNLCNTATNERLPYHNPKQSKNHREPGLFFQVLSFRKNLIFLCSHTAAFR